MFAKTFRSVVSLLLVSCLLLGLGGNVVHAANPVDGALGTVDNKVYTTIGELNAMIDNLEDQIDALELVLLDGEAKLAEGKELLQTAKDLLAEVEAGDLKEANEKLADAETKLAEVKDMLDNADDEFAKKEAEAWDTFRNTMADEKAKAKAQFDADLKKAEKAYWDEVNNLAADLPDAIYQEKIAEAQAKWDADAAKALADFNGQVAKAEADAQETWNNELADARAEFDEKVAEGTEALAKAEAEMNKVREYISNINNAVAEYKETIAYAEEVIAEAELMIADAKVTVAEARETIAHARELVDNLENSYNDLRDAVTNPRPSISYIRETVAETKANYDAVWNALLTLDQDIDDLIVAYEALEGYEIGSISVKPFYQPAVKINAVQFEVSGTVYGVSEMTLPEVSVNYNFSFDGITVPEMPAMLNNLDTTLDGVIAKGVTLTNALNYYYAVANNVVSKVLGKLENLGLVFDSAKDLGVSGTAAVYNWLYNNPDKVCHIVKEFGVHGLDLVINYGPYALDLIEKHDDLVILGLMATAGGTYLTATMGAKALGYAGDHMDFLADYKDYVAAAAYKLYSKFGPEAKALIKVYTDYLQVGERYFNATHANYVTNKNSLYVAIGDNSCVGESYVDLLAHELAVDTESLLVNGVTIQTVIAQNKDLLSKADLISIGYSMNTCNDAMMSRIESILLDGTYEPVDWTALVGAGYDAKVEAAVAKLKNELLSYGVSGNFGFTEVPTEDVLTVIAECYVYEYIGYVWNLRQALNDIQAINPKAQVILVGMYNPFEGVVLNVNGREIPFGTLMDSLVETMDVYYLTTALTNDKVIFVNAPAVENDLADGTYELFPLLYNLFINGTDILYANEEGHEYIKDQIWNALTLKLLGDVDCDGDIDNIDAMRALQCYVQMIPEGAVCDRLAADVDNDGDVDNIDAMFILQYYVGVRKAF